MRIDFEKVYKDTLDNIFQAIDPQSISKYIESPFEENKGNTYFNKFISIVNFFNLGKI